MHVVCQIETLLEPVLVPAKRFHHVAKPARTQFFDYLIHPFSFHNVMICNKREKCERNPQFLKTGTKFDNI